LAGAIAQSVVGDFVFELAGPDDDPAIRRLLANNSVPGRVSVTYEREPDYFLGCSTMGRSCQVLVARHQPSGQVVGVATRTIRPLFVNGQVEEVGYIGQLRVDRQFQGRWLVSSGFRFLHRLHEDGRVKGYITTIIEGNAQAQGILIRRARRHFPVYREVDRLCTLAIILRKPKPALPTTCEVGPATTAELGAIVAFLRQQGAQKQFFPVYRLEDFDDSRATRGFRINDFVVARHDGQVVGVVGLWDQSSYKQTVVHAYHNWLYWLRPVYNVGLRIGGARPLPPPGRPIDYAYASFICVANNDPGLFRVLLRQVYNLAAARGYPYLMLGLSERDPLLRVARQYAHIPYHSRLYTVCWKDEVSFHERLDRRLPYVEIATL
jgi:hypothetical protein